MSHQFRPQHQHHRGLRGIGMPVDRIGGGPAAMSGVSSHHCMTPIPPSGKLAPELVAGDPQRRSIADVPVDEQHASQPRNPRTPRRRGRPCAAVPRPRTPPCPPAPCRETGWRRTLSAATRRPASPRGRLGHRRRDDGVGADRQMRTVLLGSADRDERHRVGIGRERAPRVGPRTTRPTAVITKNLR